MQARPAALPRRHNVIALQTHSYPHRVSNPNDGCSFDSHPEIQQIGELAALNSCCAKICDKVGAADADEGEGEGRAKRFLPFSLGTRDCVGQSLARMSAITTVAMLLARFRFQLADKVPADRTAAALLLDTQHRLSL